MIINHIITHHNTSIGVCQSLSFSIGWSFLVILKTLVILDLISFIYFACCHDSNLTFIASYATIRANPQEKAKNMLSNQKYIRIIVVMLVTIPAWKDGNHHAENILDVWNFLYLIESTIILINCIINHTIIKINNGLILIPPLKYISRLSCIKENISLILQDKLYFICKENINTFKVKLNPKWYLDFILNKYFGKYWIILFYITIIINI